MNKFSIIILQNYLCNFLQQELCKPRNDDNCLQSSPNWSMLSTCDSRTRYCISWGKDMRRCCPNSCGTGTFTEADCLSFEGEGTCIYPNNAQCIKAGK